MNPSKPDAGLKASSKAGPDAGLKASSKARPKAGPDAGLKASRTFRPAVFFPIGAAALAAAVFGGLLLANPKQTRVEVNTPAEPEIGYTGFDRAVNFAIDELEPLPDDSSMAEAGLAAQPSAANAETAAVERQFASQLAPDFLSAADRKLLEALQGLDARAGAAMLNQLGYSSQQTCGAQPFIADFALPDDPTHAIVTPQNADRTAEDVAAAVWEYYQVLAQVYRDPGLAQLFCLARVATLPKLKWQWSDLRELVARQASVEFSQPLEVRVVGLLTGHAVAVACLPSGAYGQLALDDEPIATELLLRWAGGRWRVSAAEDFPGDSCREFAAQTRKRYENDTADTGESWILF